MPLIPRACPLDARHKPAQATGMTREMAVRPGENAAFLALPSNILISLGLLGILLTATRSAGPDASSP